MKIEYKCIQNGKEFKNKCFLYILTLQNIITENGIETPDQRDHFSKSLLYLSEEQNSICKTAFSFKMNKVRVILLNRAVGRGVRRDTY